MTSPGRLAIVCIATAAITGGVVVAGGAAATKHHTRTKDRVALKATAQHLDWRTEKRINALIRKMTLDEKLDQLTLLSDGQINDDEARKPVGGVFSLTDPAKIDHYQRIAVEQSRLHIPILFAFDTIHGFRTVFPIPLGTAASFDPAVASTDHAIGAAESATVGLKQIYSPMVDVSHEPRWGRISEAAGEDTYLNSVMAAARVKGAQGDDYSAEDKVVTSVKHFAAYGQPEAGRDYNTTDMSLSRLWNYYLPPFKAAVDAGADTAMCSFNAINGKPGCANRYLETRVMKDQWGFDGFIESDYTAVAELRACPPLRPDSGPCGHGIAEDGAEAAQKALNAGTDSEMVSTNYRDFGKELVQSGRVPMRRIDDAVRRILRVKFRAGPVRQRPLRPRRQPRDADPGCQSRRRPARGAALDGAAEERRADAPVRPGQDDRRDRPARAVADGRQRQGRRATTCSARGGASGAMRTPCRHTTASRRSRPARRTRRAAR